ncbi:hypothetical protein D3C78_1794600 [compost metagenome]
MQGFLHIIRQCLHLFTADDVIERLHGFLRFFHGLLAFGQRFGRFVDHWIDRHRIDLIQRLYQLLLDLRQATAGSWQQRITEQLTRPLPRLLIWIEVQIDI